MYVQLAYCSVYNMWSVYVCYICCLRCTWMIWKWTMKIYNTQNEYCIRCKKNLCVQTANTSQQKSFFWEQCESKQKKLLCIRENQRIFHVIYLNMCNLKYCIVYKTIIIKPTHTHTHTPLNNSIENHRNNNSKMHIYTLNMNMN